MDSELIVPIRDIGHNFVFKNDKKGTIKFTVTNSPSSASDVAICYR